MVVVLFLYLLGNQSIVHATESNRCTTNVNNREILVQLQETSSVNDISLREVQASEFLTKKNIHIYHVPANMDYQQVIEQLQSRTDVIHAEPNNHRCTTNLLDEPDFSKQWYMEKIDIAKASEITRGSEDITIAVLDTGVNANHPELTGRVLPGYDVVNSDEDAEDHNGHGTFVAGIIAANIDGTGIAGMTDDVKILPVKIGKDDGTMVHSDIIEGIYYAIEQDVDIINMSYTGSTVNSLEKKALEEAHAKGIILVGASGNYGDTRQMYPASYPMVISVGATKKLKVDTYMPKLLRAGFSNYGPNIDVSAPGVNIYSIYHDGGYRSDDGTSFAAPQVSGLAALIKSLHPAWESEMVEWAIEQGAMNGGQSAGYWDEQLGYGVINVYESLQLTEADLSSDISEEMDDAATVQVNQTVSEAIRMPGDVDWFTFAVTKAAEVDIALDPADTKLSLDLAFYHAGQEDPIYRMDKRKENERKTMHLKTGTYYVKVHDRDHHWSNSKYQLSISSDQLPTPKLELLEVSQVFEASHQITGKATPFSVIQVKGTESWTGYTDKNGDFVIDIPQMKAGSKVVVSVTDGFGNYVSSEERLVTPFYDDVTMYSDQIRFLSERGILRGYPDGTFKPSQSVTRLQAIQVMLNELGVEVKEEKKEEGESILGVKPGAYGYEFLVKAKDENLLMGLKSPASDSLTRGEMAVLLANAYQLSGGNNESVFKDIEKDTSLFNAVNALVANKVVNGFEDQTYRPDEAIRRDHFAVLFSKVMEK